MESGGISSEKVKNIFDYFKLKNNNIDNISNEVRKLSSKVDFKLKKYCERIFELKEYIDQQINNVIKTIEELKCLII